MDDFTKNMLERAKQRRQKLNCHLSQAGRTPRPLQESHHDNIEPINYDTPVLKNTATRALFDNNTSNAEQPKPFISESTLPAPETKLSVSSKLQQLGTLYSENGENLSSPIHARAEEKILTQMQPGASQAKCRLGRLNQLASTISGWEDDLSHPDLKKRPEGAKSTDTVVLKKGRAEPKPAAPKPGTAKITKTETKLVESTVTTVIHMATIDKSAGADKVNKTTATITGFAGGATTKRGENEDVQQKGVPENKVPRLTGVTSNSNLVNKGKQTQWDEAIKLTLESQGFNTSNSPKQTYNFGDSRQSSLSSSPKSSLSPNVSPRSSAIHRKSTASPAKALAHKGLKKAQAPLPPSAKKAQAPLRPSGVKKNPAPDPPSPMKTRLSGNLKQRIPSPRKSPKMGVSALDPEKSVLKRAAMFEKQLSPVKKSKDPTELSLAERTAMFEKKSKGGEIILPKVPFATPLPAKLRSSPVKSTKEIPKLTKNVQPAKAETHNAVSMIKEQLERNLVEATNEVMAKLEREKDLEFLNNRFKKFKQGYADETTGPAPPPPPMPTAPVLSPTHSPSSQSKNRFSTPKTSGSPRSKLLISPKTALQASPIKNPKTSGSPRSKLLMSPKITRKTQKVSFDASSQKHAAVTNESTPEQYKEPPVQYKDSPEAIKAVEAVRKIALSPPKQGRLYPSLSDIEVNGESDSSSPNSSMNDSKNSNIYLNMSFGDILEASKQMPMTPPRTQESAVLNEMDELLDAALGDVTSEEDGEGPTPPKQQRGVAASSSFEYSRTPNTPKRQDTTPLLRTVSVYRKEQTSLSTPVSSSKLSHHLDMSWPDNDREPVDEAAAVKLKMRELQAEMDKQATIISQASNALSVCMANIEFSNSEEQVVGERLLLLAESKRKACEHEYQRLQVDGTLRPRGSNQDQLHEQGSLVISNITLPIKRDAIRNMAAEESMLHFVCLVRCEDKVVASEVVRATGHALSGNIVTIPGDLKLEQLYGDFKATVEVYSMNLRRDVQLPHHIKYHLPGKKDKRLLTPLKSKKSQSRLVMPNMQSPAGPFKVRSTSFKMCGYIVFSLREVKRTNWSLNRVTPHSKSHESPLEGSMGMQIACSLKLDAEHRGFLNMFDDVSGLGAWHRRWCLLSAHHLSYWKYPDDEKKQVPLGSIDLRSVITPTVGQVSREICARNNTFLLETTRPLEPQDRESLVLLLDGDTARIRHLLCADLKEEAIEWCGHLNKALALIRAWNQAE